MTKKFEKAKAETIEKYTKTLGAIRMAQVAESPVCSFCRSYSDCDECPVDKPCSKGLHLDIRFMLIEAAQRVEKVLRLLKELKEKQPRRK